MDKPLFIYHEDLIQLINRGGTTRKELLLSLIGIKTTYVKRAKAIIENYKTEYDNVKSSSSKYQIPLYQGNNKFVMNLMQELDSAKVKDDLLGAYVHGSLATNEEINYSDFDALVILKNSAFEDPIKLAKICKKLNQLSRLFYQYDPLQHHGWFVLTESMLECFPQTYFPPILFENSKSILKDKGNCIEIKLPIGKGTAFEEPFFQLSATLEKHLQLTLKDKNAFVLKSILSQLMLLPAFYLQAKSKKGVFKKESFNLAAKDFSKSDWEIMDKVSKIRTNWNYKINSLQRSILTSDKYLIRKAGRKFVSNVSSDTAKEIDDELHLEMLELTRLMKKNIERRNEEL